MVAPFFHVDAFTDAALRGNPAAVVVLDDERDDVWLQAVAAEMNLPETAFLRPLGGGVWSLRWCTPTVEVELCGHATLASAHALWELGRATEGEPIAFDTRSGRLVATRRDARIELEFPALIVAPRPAPAGVLAALGVRADEVEFAASHPNGYGFLVVADAARVRALQPDFVALGRQPEAFLVTAPSDHPEYDFVSRFFAPSFGIDEDPVTGAAHCMLGPYWSSRLGKPVVTGFQASARTGVVECEPRGDRVLLRGNAVTVVQGELVA
ncbi:MAG TPA: PhzF family phenazine biosynthesis isomerase [Acidimicrobiia bacterium]|jgi:PhzF family phenazine biosynthesis protein